MAKRPTLKTVVDGYYNRDVLNYNFEQIARMFDEALSRDTSTPNAMNADLDVSDANVTNVDVLKVTGITVVDEDWTGFDDEYLYLLSLLNCNDGAIITHQDGDPVCLPVGTDGEVLKTIDGGLAWSEDIDTDTDTVGVTVQEDGVTVAENVTTIDFKWTGGVLVTNPVASQVDLDLEELLGPLFEDTTQADTNLDPESDLLFANAAEVTRIDLSTLSGVTLPLDGSELTVVAEASNYFEDSVSGGASSGGWELDVRFYRDDGTSTPLTGTEIVQGGTLVQGSSAGGNLLTLIQNIPANTKYVDFGWSLVPTFPLFLTITNFSDRYRAIIPQSQNGTFVTPNGHATQGVRASTSPTT